MITEIEINNVATYKSQKIYPDMINFVYGNNGVGKSTLAKVITNVNDYENCKVDKSDDEYILTYNKKFINDNFRNKSKINGVFTLGENNASIIENIEQIKRTIKEKKEKLIHLNSNLKEKEQSLNKINEIFYNSSWKLKDKIYNDFKKAFYRKSIFDNKKHLADFLINYSTDNDYILNYEELLEEYKLLYSKDEIKLDKIELINVESFIDIEKNDLFNLSIIGKENLFFSEFIKQNDNSAWLEEGLNYIHEDKCPFCQKKLENYYIKMINEYFDNTYKIKIDELLKLKETYLSLSEKYQKLIDKIKENDKFSKEKNNYCFEVKEIINENIIYIEEKIKKPSEIINLKSTEKYLEIINMWINDYNEIVDNNSDKLNKMKESKKIFFEKLSFFMVNEIGIDYINKYKADIVPCEKGISSLNEKITNEKNDIKMLEKQNRELSKTISGIDNSIEKINHILIKFGFTNFKLAKAEEPGYYKLIRENGSLVEETLSEGESNFISFLYYYCCIEGSIKEDELYKEKILVIDDPISSLDSNTIYIVSTLIKNMVEKVYNESGSGYIKQIFVFTHNTYFFKEVSNFSNKYTHHNKYFVIKKKDSLSSIEEYEKNPIKSSYELLWKHYAESTDDDKTVFNSMRRILEHYFKYIGNENYESIISKFNENDQKYAWSLISFLNDGSHSVFEDEFITTDISIYKKIFKDFFENSGQISHYNLMMKS